MAKPHAFELTAQERKTLQVVIDRKNAQPARYPRRARTLLLAAEGHSDRQIAAILQIDPKTVRRTCRRFIEEGIAPLLEGRAQRTPGHRPKLEGEKRAALLALAASPPPEGCSQWSLRSLANRLVELNVVQTCSYETVRRTLNRTESTFERWQRRVQLQNDAATTKRAPGS